jgi:hypothetical protein
MGENLIVSVLVTRRQFHKKSCAYIDWILFFFFFLAGISIVSVSVEQLVSIMLKLHIIHIALAACKHKYVTNQEKHYKGDVIQTHFLCTRYHSFFMTWTLFLDRLLMLSHVICQKRGPFQVLHKSRVTTHSTYSYFRSAQLLCRYTNWGEREVELTVNVHVRWWPNDWNMQ